MVKVDTEKYPRLAGRFNVRGIPNFVVIPGGRVVMQQAGLVGAEQMEEWIRSAAAQARRLAAADKRKEQRLLPSRSDHDGRSVKSRRADPNGSAILTAAPENGWSCG